MKRIFLIVFFVLLSMCELGFVSALPFPVDRLPLVLVASVFLFQSLDVRPAAWWMVLHGVFLDLLQTSSIRFEIVPHAVAALVLVLASRHLFSNRSFWGVLGTFALSLFALSCTEILLSIFQALFEDFSLSFDVLVAMRLWGLGLGTLLLLIFFPLTELLTRAQKNLLSF